MEAAPLVRFKHGRCDRGEEGKNSNFNTILIKDQKVPNTIASSSVFVRTDVPRQVSDSDVIRIQIFPREYDFMDADI